MEVNSKTLQGLSLLDAYQSFRNLHPGPVTIVVKRGSHFMVCFMTEDIVLQYSSYSFWKELIQSLILFQHPLSLKEIENCVVYL